MAGRIYIGTSGWNYRGWRKDFYASVPSENWLEFCAERFSSIEVNATFYRLQERKTFRRWRRRTPADFRFAIKGNRYLTHNKKLIDPLPSVRIERDRAAGLGDKLAAVVWQLPRSFRKNMERLHGFAKALRSWRSTRHAIEFRHNTWFDKEVFDCLKAHELAVCQSDATRWPLWDAVTTDMVYVRLHGHTRTYVSSYSAKQLRLWADRSRRWRKEGRDVHIYFDNDAAGAAPRNALDLIALLKKADRAGP